MPVLVPNERGLDRALEKGSRHIAIFGSATETFAQRNLNRGLTSSSRCSSRLSDVLARPASTSAPTCRCASATRGRATYPSTRSSASASGCSTSAASQLSLGDTIGVGTPGHVVALLDAFNAVGLGDDVLAMHFHDTYGQALANTTAALRHGVTTFDASAGGLGGCPYAESATGNLATEDLVWMLHGLGIETGVDLERLVRTSVWMAEQLGRPSPSRVVQALAG